VDDVLGGEALSLIRGFVMNEVVYAQGSGTASTNERCRGRVLVVDDEAIVGRVISRILQLQGHTVDWVPDTAEARFRLRSFSYDVVLTDLNMPGGSGIDLIRSVHLAHPETSFILITGVPEVESAISAVGLGVSGYLSKPVDRAELEAAVRRGVRRSRSFGTDRIARDLLARTIAEERQAEERRCAADDAIRGLRMAYQPLFRMSDQEVIGFEALMRFPDGSFSNPGEMLAAAERLNLTHKLGRAVRGRVAEAIRLGAVQGSIFVNLHSSELLDSELFEGRGPLAQYAESVVLEITERQSLEICDETLTTLNRLRDLGFRIAIDDLGTGYSGLASVVLVRPDIVKMDMSLTRAIDQDPMRRRIVDGLVTLCHDSGIEVVAEGVETEAELAAIDRLGCDLAQGFLLGRPELRLTN